MLVGEPHKTFPTLNGAVSGFNFPPRATLNVHSITFPQQCDVGHDLLYHIWILIVISACDYCIMSGRLKAQMGKHFEIKIVPLQSTNVTARGGKKSHCSFSS